MRRTGGSSGRWLARVLACCVAGVLGLFVWVGLSGTAGGSGASAVADTSGVTAQGPSLDSLVVPSVQALDEDQQATDAQRARHSSSVAYVARIRSRTEFEHLGTARAAQVASEAFPEVIDHPEGGPPQLPAGTKLARYIAPNAAQVELPGDKHGVIESMGPMAKEVSSGHFTPIDLGLMSNGRGYVPTTSDVNVQIPKRVADGVRMPETGVSLTPVDAQGVSLQGSEGSVDGATVLYANTQADADTVVKPTTVGFEVDVLLRSPESPDQLYFQVGMPSGAQLVQRVGSDVVSVVLDGRMIAGVQVPEARDAAGVQVPVVMTVKGSSLDLTVADHSSEYQYPIEVDPNTYDPKLFSRTGPKGEILSASNWHFHSNPEGHIERGGKIYGFTLEYPLETVLMKSNFGLATGQYMEYIYESYGEASVFYIETEVAPHSEWNAVAKLEFAKGSKVEDEEVLPQEDGIRRMCAPPGGSYCGELKSEQGNHVRFQQTATTETGQMSTSISKAEVGIVQTKAPEVGYNTSSATLVSADNRQNILYGGGGWLSEHSGAFEINTHDPGLGVSNVNVRATGGSWKLEVPIQGDNDCSGVWCAPSYNTPITYNTSMTEGEDPLELCAEDAARLTTCSTSTTIKVDNTPPRSIKLNGLLEKGAEISAAPHQVTIEATDGTKLVPSSGIKSIKAAIDGKEIGQPQGYCTRGECTASGTWTINAENLGAGVHELVVAATDNAGNELIKQYTFAVRNATPIAIGPGTVDPTTGQFALSATDVSLAGVGGVARTYHSRQLTAGTEGPLGPQWAVDLGTSESLTVLPNGNAMLAGASGGLTTFNYKGKGEFESPEGDSNLTLEGKETEYLLKDVAQGSATVFKQPTGTLSTAPAYADQFGAPGPGNGQLNLPVGEALDSSGNLWVADYYNNRIEKFSPAGEFLASYTDGGQLSHPWGIAIEQSTGDLYVTDQGHNRVVVLSPSGSQVRTIEGVGEHALNLPEGITIGPSGGVWIVDYGNSRLEEFTSTGTFERVVGSSGSSEGHFSAPYEVAFSGTKMYVTDCGNNRIDKFSSATYAPEGSFGASGTGNGQFNCPHSIAIGSGTIYVSDANNNRVQEFNEKGEYLAQFGSGGSSSGQFSLPRGLAVTSAGVIYIADSNNNRVSVWSHPQWFAALAEGPTTSSGDTYSYKAVTVENKTVIEPIEELGPKPEGAVCSAEPGKSGKAEKEKEVGCRLLTFKYAEKTGAGEKEGEWGEYNGRLMKVLFTAYNPATKAMEVEKPVAEYAYDKQGRLRAEWDPRISPALKMIYGYDSEGHVTALTPPGQESWAFTYGTANGDSSTGRLLKVTRPSAVTGLWAGTAPENTAKPALSTSKPVVGGSMNVTTGTWNNNPLAYGYQWFSCKEEVGQYNEEIVRCEPILGAVNPSYTPLTSDRGRELYVEVRGTNGGGSTSACTGGSVCGLTRTEAVSGSSELSQEPVPPPPTYGTNSVWTIEYHLSVAGTGRPGLPNLTKEETAKWGQTKDLPTEGMAIFPPDEPMGWPASNYKRASLTYLDEQGRTVNLASPSGAISTTEYNKTNEVVRTLSADNRAAALKEAKPAEVAELLDTKTEYNPEGTEIVKALGPQHLVKLKGGAEVQARNDTHYYYDEHAPGGETYRLATRTTDAALEAGKEEDKRTVETSYSGQDNLGWKLRKPTSTTVDPGGLNLTTTTVYQEGTKKERESTGAVVETKSPAGTASAGISPKYSTSFGSFGTGGGQLDYPEGIAVAPNGNLYISDSSNNRVQEFSPSGTFVETFGFGVSNGKEEYEVCTSACKAGIEGSGNGQFKKPRGIAVAANGNVYVSDQKNDRVEEFTGSGEYVTKWGTEGTSGGQFKEPFAIAIAPNKNVYVADSFNHRIQEFSPSGTFVETFGFGVSNGKEEYEVCTSSCQAGRLGSGAGQFKWPEGVTVAGNEDVYVMDEGNERVQKFSPSGTFVETFGFGVSNGKEEYEVCTSACKAGIEGSGNGQFKKPRGIAVAANGNVYVADLKNSRVEQFSASGEYEAKFGSEGTGLEEFKEPVTLAVAQGGAVYITDTGNQRIQVWLTSTTSGNPAAHDSKIIYYSAKGEAEIAACQNHPEWVNLPCQTEPAAQPGVGGAPELPVTLVRYNVWDAPETTEEKFGSVTRTKKETFDGDGREETSEVFASPATDKAVPKVTDTYSKETGALIEQSTTTAGKTQTITSVYNTLGQLEKYTDASSGVTKYVYETGGDGRLLEMNYEIGSEKFGQLYSYNATTGFMESLYDSGLKKYFTATYDVEGTMLTNTYPDNLTAHYTYNQLGSATGIKYEKNAYCASKCPETWFEESIVPSIHGETLKQTSTLAKENYAYDNDGRLIEAQETPAGKGCTARLYGYDEESNRTSLTTRESAAEACPTEGGTIESHSYDSANNVIDSGVNYEAFGNVTKLPAPDAGKYELKSSYYVDSQIATQEQRETTNKEKFLSYAYDPAGRTEETEAVIKESGKEVHEPIVTSNYSGPGETPTWTGEEGNKKWIRDVPGIDGALDAIQTSAGSMTLQLHDLQGNTVATTGLSETETKLTSSYNSTEFGAPNEGKPVPKYAWMGSGGISSELPSSGTVTQDGGSYVPQIARSLQPEGIVPPGAYPNGSGPGGPYITHESPESIQSGVEASGNTLKLWEAEKQKEQEEEAARVAQEQCEQVPLSCVTVEDPIKHLRAWEAEKWAKEIREKSGEPLVKLLATLLAVVEGPEEILEGLFGEDSVEQWANALASNLETCVSELHRTKHSHGGCRVDIFDYEPFGIDTHAIDFSDLPEVTWCEGMSSDTKEVHWCHLIPHPPSEEGDIL
jgi:sugar lactone lactonase YvrE